MLRATSLVLLVLLVSCGPPAPAPPDGGTTCGSPLTPPNVVVDPAFECGTHGWSAQSGEVAVVEGGRSGKALQLTASATGAGQAGLPDPLVATTSGSSYCLSAWVKGTAMDARFEVLATQAGSATAFSTPLTSSWVRAPMSSNLKVTVPAGDTLYLRVRLLGAQAGQTLVLDDVDFYESADGGCRERL